MSTGDGAATPDQPGRASFEMGSNALVREAHLASYPDPLRAVAGTALKLDGREWDWSGHRWLWAEDPNGRGGWVPEEYLDGNQLRRDYSAQELNAQQNTQVTVLFGAGGWSWCRLADGREGWLPDEKLQAVS